MRVLLAVVTLLSLGSALPGFGSHKLRLLRIQPWRSVSERWRNVWAGCPTGTFVAYSAQSLSARVSVQHLRKPHLCLMPCTAAEPLARRKGDGT
jgi:hypothetical protein